MNVGDGPTSGLVSKAILNGLGETCVTGWKYRGAFEAKKYAIDAEDYAEDAKVQGLGRGWVVH